MVWICILKYFLLLEIFLLLSSIGTLHLFSVVKAISLESFAWLKVLLSHTKLFCLHCIISKVNVCWVNTNEFNEEVKQ